MSRLRHKMLRKPSQLRRAKRDFLGICGVSDCCNSAVDRIGICKSCLIIIEKEFKRASEFRCFIKIFKSFSDYVYFIHAEGTSAIKIGIADDPVKRLMNLQVGNQHNLKLITCMRANPEIECAMHEKFRQSNIRGEWFTIGEDMLDMFEQIAAMKKPECLNAWSSSTGHLIDTTKTLWAMK